MFDKTEECMYQIFPEYSHETMYLILNIFMECFKKVKIDRKKKDNNWLQDVLSKTDYRDILISEMNDKIYNNFGIETDGERFIFLTETFIKEISSLK